MLKLLKVKRIVLAFAMMCLVTLAYALPVRALMVEFNASPSTSWADGTFSSHTSAGLGLADGFYALSQWKAANGYGVSGESIYFNNPVFLHSFDIMPFIGHSYWYAATIISEYDIHGNLLGQQIDNPNATDFETLNVELSDVSTITFTHSSPYNNGSIPNASWFLVQNITYDKHSPVPEPSTFLLLGAGFAGIGFLRRRAKK